MLCLRAESADWAFSIFFGLQNFAHRPGASGASASAVMADSPRVRFPLALDHDRLSCMMGGRHTASNRGDHTPHLPPSSDDFLGDVEAVIQCVRASRSSEALVTGLLLRRL